ncbi:uncharacterized protein FTJAE_5020 [Fusarium tjaetaba]|uniref:Uncharacterized protein n=1 Tax=Fusarium tjaetaba TaxID=1567544 RepID=A0A8H5RSD6_9HYPO|nr:uncharacterized protein FTJAE_5020 [Fusarium tjaetaba]KAF5638949.1 hypothetical protein FTJAE_5020 [Fusarium tjaetaba]
MSSDTGQRSLRSQAPSQRPEARILNQQNAIAEKTGTTVAELQGMFSTAKLRHGWVAIHEAIQAEVAQRQQGVYRSSSKTAAWMPIDVSNAKKRLDGGAGAALPLPTPLPPTKSGDRPEVHIVLCAIGDPESQSLYGEHGVRSIDVTPTDDFQGLLLDTLDVEFYEKLEEEAGVGLCYNTGIKAYEEAEANGEELPEGPDTSRVTVHGIVITLLWAQYTGRITVEFKSWEWLQQKVKEGTIGAYLGNFKQDAILFTHMRRPHLSEESVDHQFDVASLNDQIRRANLVFPNNISRYPSPEEDDADMCQLPDARILDVIASDETTPPEFRFRPRVCYSQSRDCTMRGYRGKIIVRGSSSTGPGDIQIGLSDDPKLTKLLKCHTNYNHGTDHSANMYFHQELKESVADWGEASVFMVGDTIFSMAMSRGIWTDPDAHHSGFTADRCLTNWHKINRSAQNATRDEARRKEGELRRFAIFQRQELLKRKPREFESLKVSVRLDIGISDATKHGLFFVTNVARWPGADMLSAWQEGSQPYDSIFEAVGTKFALECGRLMQRDESEEDEGRKGQDGHEGNQEREEGNDTNETDFSDPPSGLLSESE